MFAVILHSMIEVYQITSIWQFTSLNVIHLVRIYCYFVISNVLIIVPWAIWCYIVYNTIAMYVEDYKSPVS